MARLSCDRLMTTTIYLLLTVIGAQRQVTAALTQALCSNYNTGLDSPGVTDHYQSNGKCFDTCKASYAFAVVQDTSCWCSNYAPSDTVDVGSCSKTCPGYGFEQCGSPSDGLFGYVALNKKPSGTIGPSSSSSLVPTPTSTSISTSSTPPVASTQPVVSVQPIIPSTPDPVTVQQTVTAAPSVVISVVSVTPSTTSTPQAATTAQATSIIPSTTSITPTTSSTPTSTPTSPVIPLVPDTSSSSSSSSLTSQPSAPASSWTPTPVASVITVEGGMVTTVTVTPTNPPLETALSQKTSSNGGFMHNTGAVVGVFTVVGLVVAVLIGLGVWALLRRRRHAGSIPVGSIAGGDTPQRRPSRLSQMGLMGNTTRSSVHGIQTAGLQLGSHGDETAEITPVTPRASYPRIVDQRLDPDSLWDPLRHFNGSHTSLHSLQDNRDYSRRMFRVTNPDA